jgi:lipid II:glycine glycyltransferase (peptidoglycan interpeptide bridge formation enzyme)
MRKIYEAMQSYKDLDEQFSYQELSGLLQHFKDQLFLYRCETPEGQVIALRGCAVSGGSAWDLFAAAAPEARKVYASYGLVWELLKACQSAGVKNYDFMGVDPVHNPGVYNFKKGTGAEEVRVVGEWEWSRPALLGNVANWMIERRGASL